MILSNTQRLILCGILVVVIILIYYGNLSNYVTFDFFNQQKLILQHFVHDHYLLSVLLFILCYTITIALSIPGAATLSLIGGFLFNVIPGIFYIVLGATSGAILACLSVRYLIGSWLQNRYKDSLIAFNKELESSGIYYLLSLRLIPVIPFFVVNILTGLTRIPLKTFIWTTVVGIIPAAFVFSFAGQQLQTIESPSDILSPPILIALFLLAALALLPVITKRFFKQRA